MHGRLRNKDQGMNMRIALIGAAAVVIATIVGALLGWPEVKSWLISQWQWDTGEQEVISTTAEEEDKTTWKGSTVGELVDHIKGGKFKEGVTIRFRTDTNMEDLKFLLVDQESVPRYFPGPTLRAILVEACDNNIVCLSCSWSPNGKVVTLGVRKPCIQKAKDSPYYVCKRQC